MQNNLLTSLHKLAHRQDENFITESFVHLIRHILIHHPRTALTLLKKITGGFLSLSLNDAERISITTQVATESGRPDIEISTDSLLVFIEVKVESDLGHKQLSRYRKALNESGYEKDNTSLVLLTRYDWEGSCKDEKPDFHIKWHVVSEYLDKMKLKNEISEYLINQFVGLLKNRGISMDSVGWQLVDGVKSMRNLLDMLGEVVTDLKFNKKPLKGGKDWIGYWLDDKRSWIGIVYDEPEYVKFEVKFIKPISSDILEKLDIDGEELENPQRWDHWLNLTSERSYFFAREKSSQLKYLKDYIKGWSKKVDSLRKAGY